MAGVARCSVEPAPEETKQAWKAEFATQKRVCYACLVSHPCRKSSIPQLKAGACSWVDCWQSAAYWLHTHGNVENAPLLFWLAATTPFLEEAQRAVATIERLESHHPSLPGSRQYVRKWQQKGVSSGKDRRNTGRLRGFLIIGIILLLLFVINRLQPTEIERKRQKRASCAQTLNIGHLTPFKYMGKGIY